jgi:hypothetical protein
MTAKSRAMLLLGLVALGLSVAGYAYRQHKRYGHLAVHDQGMVYRSAWLQGEVFAELISKYQIRTILNLCNPDEMGRDRCLDQRQFVRGSGANLVELPLPPTTLAEGPEVEQLVKILSNPDSYPILVHCQHGVTRTAKVLAMYDILYRGKSAEASLAAQPLFGRDSYNVAVYAFARDFEQRNRKLFPQTAGALDRLRR